MSKFYAAYSSDLFKWLMGLRCPTAEYVGPGRIEGYELQFRGAYQGADATIVPKEGSYVPVGIWQIQKQDEKYLNRHFGYPKYYSKQELPVRMDGWEIEAMTYVMDPKFVFGEPGAAYLSNIRQGYCDCGLDMAVLDQAVQDSSIRGKQQMEERNAMRLG